MAVTYRSSGTIVANGDAGVDMSSSLPSGLSIDDIMIFEGLDADDEHFDAAMPDGWISFESNNTVTNAGGTYAWKRYDGTETDWQFDTPSGSGQLVMGVIHAFQGAIKIGNPITLNVSNFIINSGTHDTSSIPNVSGLLGVAMFSIEDDVAVTKVDVVGTWTERDNQTTTVGSDGRLICCTTTSSGNIIERYTTGTSEYSFNCTFALIPETNRPTIVPNTADAHDFGADDTPTLEFTGSDANDDDLEYQLQILSANDTDVDKYVESNEDSNLLIGTGNSALGQSFTGNSDYLTKATFYFRKQGSPTGVAYAKIYAHSGTFGTSSVPTGNELATSALFDVSTLTTSYALIDFLFDGTFQMVNTTKYVIILTYWQGDGSNHLEVATDSSPTHAGNSSSQTQSTEAWVSSSRDLIFYVEGLTRELNKLSVTPDATFTNTTDGGDTHPFDQPDLIDYTVQGGDALADGEWFWRARAIDTGGTNEWSDWTTIRSFDIGGTDPPRGNKLRSFITS